MNEQIEMWYHKLEKLMWAMAWDYVNTSHWRLQADELFAELSAELVEVVQKYANMDKSEDEMYKLITTSLRNRCRDIAAMAYGTHRKAESTMESLDDPDFVQDPATYDHPFDITLLSLSSDAERLVQEALDPSTRQLRCIELVVMRKQTIAPKGHWSLHPTPWILRRALGWDKERFENAWTEVSNSLACLRAGSV